MAKLWMSRVPTTPFIRAVVAYWCGGGVLVHPPSGGFGSDRIGTEVDGALQYAWKRIPLLWELGIGHFWPGALMSANNHGAQLTLTYFQLTYRLKVGPGTSRRINSGRDPDTGGN